MNRKLLAVLKERRTIRCYKKKMPPLSLIRKVIDTARFAPLPRNMNFFDFLVVRRKKEISLITKHIKYTYHPELTKKYRDCYPPLYVLILANLVKQRMLVSRNIYKERRIFPLEALSLVNYIAIASSVLGISSWMMGLDGIDSYTINKQKIERVFHRQKVLPFFVRVIAIVGLGYAKEKVRTIDVSAAEGFSLRFDKDMLIVPKPKLKDILHIDRYLERREK